MYSVALAAFAKGKAVMGQGLAMRLALGFAVGVGTRVFMLGMHVIVGRELGSESYGVFATMIAGMTLLGILGSLGWSETIPRFIAQYQVEKKWSLLKGAIEVSDQIVFRTTLVAGVVVAVCGFFFATDPSVKTCLIVCGFGLPIVATRQHRFRQLQGLQKTKIGMLLGEGVVPLSMGVLGLLFGLSTPEAALMSYVVVSLAIVAVMTAILFRTLPAEMWQAESQVVRKEWQAVATPAILGRSGLIFSRRIDLLMIWMILGVGATGVYSAAFRLSFALQFIPIVIGYIVQPMFARAWYDGRVDEVRRVFKGSLIASAGLAIPATIVLLVFTKQILGLFGSDFQAGESLLIVFVLGQFFDAITGPVAPLLIMTGQERVFGKSTATTAIGNIIGNLIAIPMYGVMGAALVTATSIVIMNIWQFLAAIKTLREAEPPTSNSNVLESETSSATSPVLNNSSTL